MEERQVVGCFRLPANPESAEAVAPAAGSLHYPSSWCPVDTTNQRLLPLPSYVRHYVTISHRCLAVRKEVALVEAEMLWPARPAARTHPRVVERLGQRPPVLHIGRTEHSGEWSPAAIGQEVALATLLRPVRWTRPREVPPFGAVTVRASSAAHFHARPCRRSYRRRMARKASVKTPASTPCCNLR